MALIFKPGDGVRLTASAISLYGGVPGWVPEGQGGGTPGIVLEADEARPHDPRAAARPYLVRWGNGVVNSYRVEDLEWGLESVEEPEPASNVISFIRPPRA